jgi:hypothetical protein
MSAPRSHRSLLDTWSALGLIGATGAAFAALFPISRERESRAFSGAPDMLSLSYLNLALARDPSDAALRVRVAERTLAAGQFDRARELLAPLLAARAAGAAPSAGAAALRVDIDYRAWTAVDPKDAALRSRALARLTRTIEQVHPEQLPPHEAERIAHVCAQIGSNTTRAVILSALARADLRDDDRLRAADAAWLEVNAPLASSELRAERALRFPDAGGALNAALALRRALAAGQPGPALVLFRKLRPLYGHDPRVLELGLSTLAGVDDVEALGVARELLTLRPEDGALRERIAQLSAWTRREPEPSAAAAPAGAPPTPPVPELRWELASDANAARANLDRRGVGGVTDASRAADAERTSADAGANAAGARASLSARAIERAALLESLGAPERALELLDAALGQKLVDERALWDVKLGVELRLGQKREALTTLAKMDARFGATRASVLRRSDLLLSLGELAPALELLATAPGPHAAAEERRVSAIGWELGDMARVRSAYRAIVQSSEATPDDVRRLWLLERDGGDLAASARVALAGFERHGQLDLLQLALQTALEAGDDGLVGSVLAAGQKHGAELAKDPVSLGLHARVRQGRAHQALLHDEPGRARSELGASARLLALAERTEPEPSARLSELREAQERQTLELALAGRDDELLARVYPEQAESLSARERVFVLHRLGRDEEAVGAALTGIESGALPERDSGALLADADALGADMPRQLGVLGDVLSMQGLTAARVGVDGQLSWSGGRTLGARVELTRLGTWDGQSLRLSGQDELAAELGAGIARSHLTLGVVALDGRDPRPSLRLEQGLLEASGLEVTLSARVNERSSDTPSLRVIGVEDELSARATLAFLERYSLSVHGAAELYSDRIDREPFGAGATFDASLGRSWTLPAGFGANVRVAGYVAPRFADDPAGPMPDGASWVGLGAGLARGQISLAPIAGRRLSVLVDATAGWLLPLAELGWSGRLGLGVSVLGADQLSIVASASNVVSTVPGFAAYTLGADYALSRW